MHGELGILAPEHAASREVRVFIDRRPLCTLADGEGWPIVVAVDSVGAGPGDLILYATGSSARQTSLTDGRPCDAVIMAIVDSWDVGGTNVYEKWAE